MWHSAGVWTVAASAGVVALLSASEPVFRALKLVGAAYLVYLGAQSLWAAGTTAHGRRGARASPLSPGRALRQGILTNLGNPKMAVFFASLLPQFAPDGGRVRRLARPRLPVLRADVRVAVLLRRRRRADRSAPDRAVRRVLDAVTGVVLVALGVRLATDDR